ncbi:MAG: XRE family transcriptional regulator [Capsulimonas sp.]|uniref:XRE family transcriptional regulator n=1 Tax=Capsulimonas sp. TaxID=2494211 RepID=UPI0032630395
MFLPPIGSDDRHWGVFSPTRLTVARRRRSMTKKALAEAIAVSAPAITQYEEAYNKPELETTFRIARVLNYPIEFFFDRDLNLIPDEALSFRARRSMSASLRGKMNMCGVLASSLISNAVRKKFKLPDMDITNMSGETPENAAVLLRRQWKLGAHPISNMVHLLESRGVEVYWVNEDSSCVDGFSFWQDDKPFVLLNVFKDAGDRGRFDAAHELAHLVLHRNLDVLDGHKAENEADRFAASFLLPEDQFKLESPSQPVLNHYEHLKNRWGLSIGALVRRSRDVGKISQWQYENACKEIARRGWRTKEPWKIKRETSKLHTMIFERMSKRGILPSNFAQEIKLPYDELLSLMPAAKSFEQKQLFNDDDYDLNKLDF